MSESGPGPRVRTDVGSVSFRLKKYFFLNVDSRTTPKLLNKVENRGNNRENDTWEWLKPSRKILPALSASASGMLVRTWCLVS